MNIVRCPKAHKGDSKTQNGRFLSKSHCEIVTPENFILKHCTRDYVGEVTRHANFGFNRYSGGFSRNKRNITTLWLFLTVFVYLFYSILRPGRTAGPMFTLYDSNDVFPHKDGLWSMCDYIWGKYAFPPKKLVLTTNRKSHMGFRLVP